MFTVSSDNIGIKPTVTTSYFIVQSTWVQEIIYNINVELCCNINLFLSCFLSYILEYNGSYFKCNRILLTSDSGQQSILKDDSIFKILLLICNVFYAFIAHSQCI
jgi:hypothetical protein